MKRLLKFFRYIAKLRAWKGEPMTDHFSMLRSELESFRALSSSPRAIGYFGQEVLRFHSIAGTLLENFALDDKSIDERYITHILARSVLEGFFWVTYVFFDPAKRDARYGEWINAFKKEYLKLYNEKIFPKKTHVEPADPSWAQLPQGLDINSMLTQLKNDYGDRLSYLYFVYRVASFDTHGKNLANAFETVFGKTSNFPILNLRFGVDLVANHYLVILEELRSQGEIPPATLKQ